MRQESTELIFRESSKKVELEPICQGVLEHFQLPEFVLISIFDDEERPEFISSPWLGENLCGFFRAVRRFGCGFEQWPDDIMKHLWDDQGWRCDVLIYIRNRTCQSPTGTVITFAHELQHLMQYGFSYKVARASNDLRQIFERSGQSAFPWDFPDEHEAQIVSKRIAEDIRGSDEVRIHGERQIELMSDPKKWEFFLGLEAQEPFDLLQATIPLVDKHRDALRRLFPANDDEGPDYTKQRWWE